MKFEAKNDLLKSVFSRLNETIDCDFFPGAICTQPHPPNIDISNTPSAKWTWKLALTVSLTLTLNLYVTLALSLSLILCHSPMIFH